MSNATLEITEGIQERTSRLGLKKTMLAFGEVDACHMGDRAVMGDRFTEFPIVRFKSQSAAEAALAALKSGQVFLDGYQLNGEWRGGGGQAVRQRKSHAPPALAAQPYEETSSRLLWEAPVGTNAGRNASFSGRDMRRSEGYESPPPRRRSPSPRRRSPSRRRSRSRRRRAPSRSRSAKKNHNHRASTSLSSAPTNGVVSLLRPMQVKDVGNAEDSISDNPLFRKK